MTYLLADTVAGKVLIRGLTGRLLLLPLSMLTFKFTL